MVNPSTSEYLDPAPAPAVMRNGTLTPEESSSEKASDKDYEVTNGAVLTATVSVDNVAAVLAADSKIKIAGVDGDGVLRGKVLAKDKFLSGVHSGIAMSSAIFGWDMHDELYTTETAIATAQQGFADLLAFPDLSSFRRLPFEDNLPFVLVHFGAPSDPVAACGRSLLRALCQKLHDAGCQGLAGGVF